MCSEKGISESSNQNVPKLVEMLLESYNKDELTCRIDKDNIVNKEILINVVEELRRLLFPGFFDNNKVRSEYARYLAGERLEFIQYHLKKQIAKALDNIETKSDYSKDEISKKADEITYKFLETLPKIREYLSTDVIAAFNGDPAAFSTVRALNVSLSVTTVHKSQERRISLTLVSNLKITPFCSAHSPSAALSLNGQITPAVGA